MKKFILVFIIIFITYGFTASGIFLSNEIEILELDNDCYQIIHSYPWEANSLLVKIDKNTFIWCDTPYTPDATNLVLNWFYSKYGKTTKIYEINTGFHIDNLGGNQVLINNNIPIYGSQITVNQININGKKSINDMMKWLQGKKYEKYLNTYMNFNYILPNRIFEITKGESIFLLNNQVEIYYPGESHSKDNIVVYFPEKKLLFGGCMVLSMDKTKPGYIGDANMNKWPKSVKKVMKKFEISNTVIPGHGKAGGIELLEHSINILEKN